MCSRRIANFTKGSVDVLYQPGCRIGTSIASGEVSREQLVEWLTEHTRAVSQEAT